MYLLCLRGAALQWGVCIMCATPGSSLILSLFSVVPSLCCNVLLTLFIVRELNLADGNRRGELLAETFDERRRWIVLDGPGMIQVLTKFNCFVRYPEEVCRIMLNWQWGMYLWLNLVQLMYVHLCSAHAYWSHHSYEGRLRPSLSIWVSYYSDAHKHVLFWGQFQLESF